MLSIYVYLRLFISISPDFHLEDEIYNKYNVNCKTKQNIHSVQTLLFALMIPRQFHDAYSISNSKQVYSIYIEYIFLKWF